MCEKEKFTKISLIHKANDNPSTWWNDCVVYELPFAATTQDLELFSASCHDLVQLGINAVLVRPARIDFNVSKDFISNFINVFHRVGLKVIFQLSGPIHVDNIGEEIHATGGDSFCEKPYGNGFYGNSHTGNIDDRVSSTADSIVDFSSPFIGFETSPTVFLERASIAIDSGVDGIDLGLIIEENMTSSTDVNHQAFIDLTRDLNAIIEKSGKKVVVTAIASSLVKDLGSNVVSPAVSLELSQNTDNVATDTTIEYSDTTTNDTSHLSHTFIDSVRNDNFVNAPFDAKFFLSKIRERYRVYDGLNCASAWHYRTCRSLHSNYPVASSWSKTSDSVENRISALQLLFLGLPGSTYMTYFDELALPSVLRRESFATIVDTANSMFEDQRKAEVSPWKSYKNALVIRAQYNMGSGTLASVDGFQWANSDTLVLVCERIYIVVNMSDRDVVVPAEFELLVASRTDVELSVRESQTPVCTVLPAETTAWFTMGKR